MSRPYETVLLGVGTPVVAPDRLSDYQREAALLRRALRTLRWAARQPGQDLPSDRQQAFARQRALAHLQEAVS